MQGVQQGISRFRVTVFILCGFRHTGRLTGHAKHATGHGAYGARCKHTRNYKQSRFFFRCGKRCFGVWSQIMTLPERTHPPNALQPTNCCFWFALCAPLGVCLGLEATPPGVTTFPPFGVVICKVVARPMSSPTCLGLHAKTYCGGICGGQHGGTQPFASKEPFPKSWGRNLGSKFATSK